MPAPIQLAIRSDRSVSIRESVDDVKFTLQLTIALVVLVIFLFLRNLSATIIPSLALPFSIVGTFAVMWACGYSIDNLSLMALTLSVGFVVDDAIVMLENIVRHMEMGKTRMQAALDGSAEIAFTIVSMTLSLAAVFIPILFMGGIVGRLMHEFAVTIASSILVSGLVSLTLTPMLCSRFLKAPHSVRHGRLYNGIERVFDAWLHSYGWTLRQTIRFKGITMVISVLLLAGTVYLFRIVPTGFIPSVDTGQMSGQIEAIAGDRVRRSRQAQPGSRSTSSQNDPNVAAYTANIGGDGRRAARHRPQAARPADADRGPDHRGAAAEAGAGAWRARVPARTRPRSASAACSRAASTSSRCRGPTRTSCTSSRRSSKRRCATSPGSRTSRRDLQLHESRSCQSISIASRSRRSV